MDTVCSISYLQRVMSLRGRCGKILIAVVPSVLWIACSVSGGSPPPTWALRLTEVLVSGEDVQHHRVFCMSVSSIAGVISLSKLAGKIYMFVFVP